jgi:hypothetical protein
LCEHLEVEEFGTFSIHVGDSIQNAVLRRCASCKKLLTEYSEEVPSEAIVGKIRPAKEKMRSMTIVINSDLYERLEALTTEETGTHDASKIMTEIVSLGLFHFRRNKEASA